MELVFTPILKTAAGINCPRSLLALSHMVVHLEDLTTEVHYLTLRYMETLNIASRALRLPGTLQDIVSYLYVMLAIS